MVRKLKLGEGGTIRIPQEALSQLGWHEGDELRLHVDGGAARIGPSPTVAPVNDRPDDALTTREFLDRYAGSADGGMTTDEIMAMTRGED